MNTTIPLTPAEQFSYQGIRVQSLTVPAATPRFREVQFHGVRNPDAAPHAQIPASFSRDSREALALTRATPAAAAAHARLSAALKTSLSLTPPAAARTSGRSGR